MELVRMKLADLRPNPANLRSEAGDIEALADLLDLTPGAPGEPMIPLVAMRDVNVGRIVDGHRRFEAMKKRGKVDGCNVLMCDDVEDRECAEKLIMLLTDAHQELGGDDFSKGLQEVMLLGLPESDVDKLARKKGAGRALRRAVEHNGGEKLEQLSLESAMAAQEVIDAGGTDEDYEEVMADKAPVVARDRVMRRIESRAKIEALEEKAREVGATLLPDEEMMAMSGYRYNYNLNVEDPDELAAVFAENPDVMFGYSEFGKVYGYSPIGERAGETGPTPEEAEAEKRAAELAESFSAAFSQIRAFFGSGSLASKPHLRDLTIDGFKEAIDFDGVVAAFPALEQVDGWTRVDGAVGYLERFPWNKVHVQYVKGIMRGDDNWWAGNNVPGMAELFDAALADGFRFDEASLPAKAAVESYMSGQEADSEDGEGE